MRAPTRISALTLAALLTAGLLIAAAPAASAAKATAVVTGNDFTCALGPSGGVKCWGENLYGQTGNGTVGTVEPLPVKVKKMGGGVVQIASGFAHSCAIKGKKRTLFCWGANDRGPLGDGSQHASEVPVKVKKMGGGVSSVAASGDHTCAIAGKKRTLWCWGANNFGQLGDGSNDEHHAPVKVKKMGSGVVAVSSWNSHTCAIAGKKRTLWCWGYNGDGQLGDGSTTSRLVPVKVKKIGAGIAAVSAGGYHTCAITGGARTLWCWGDNGAGQLGNGKLEDLKLPMKVKKMGKGVRDVTTGTFYTCAVTGKGAAKCWGESDSGNLGIGPSDGVHVPTQVKKLTTDVRAISAGGDHTCAIRDKGIVWCWGDNFDGQVGDGTQENERLVPVKVKL